MSDSADFIGRGGVAGKLPGQSFPDVIHQCLSSLCSHGPEIGAGNAAEPVFERPEIPAPATLATGFGPKIIGFERIPGGDMHAVCDVANRHFSLGPAREQVLKNAPAHFAVQPAHAVDRAGSANRKECHVEWFALVTRVYAAQPHELR